MKLQIDYQDIDLLGQNVTVHCKVYQSRFSTEAEFGPYKILLEGERWPEINQALYYRIEQQLKRLGIVPFEAEFDPMLVHWGSLVAAQIDRTEIILDGIESVTISNLPDPAILQINEEQPFEVVGGSYEFKPEEADVYKIVLWDQDYRPEFMKCWLIKASTVEQEKQRLREEINRLWFEHFNGGFIFNGREYDTDQKGRENLDYYTTYLLKGGHFPEGFTWTLADDTDYAITEQEFHELTNALVIWGYTLHRAAREKKLDLASLTTGAELRDFAAELPGGWPSNEASSEDEDE